ncbi:hypothetical protein BGW36DRAFT_385475 [Talaromyces proteolyticus]|uniref:Uncharacterized protein n=1 Tax=Talaromyces proteolyticus TaxID=1131652 RepID=A0AAD4KLC9_9EURO|nr:uncharacterized protein BGW36DRAFT_385475 [Talaromyces proteolyticus]KAH8692907.1 hypothetical protein BGW36DRAFT_385475 [Talaromyces proteolyticus]
MPWSKVREGRYERAIGENEKFIKIIGDAALPLNREHWAINILAAIRPIGSLAQENLSSLFCEAWKLLRFKHPTIAAYIVDETTYVYDVPDGAALEKWASETFKVVEEKTADELIASIAVSPYATMYYLPKTNELLGHWQHWRTDGVGAFLLTDDFLTLATSSPPPEASNLPWGEEVARLAPSIEEAAGLSANPSEVDKEIGAKCVGSFGHAAGAIGISSPAPPETLPGGTKFARLHLTEQETKKVIQACKARNISVTAAVHASIATANYTLAASGDQDRHYTSTIRYSFRPFLPKPYSGREYAATIFTTGWMVPVPAASSWEERAKIYHTEYRKGLSKEYISAHREYAIGLCKLLRSLPAGAPSPTDVDISSLGVAERLIDREKGTSERGIHIERVSIGLEIVNRQCVCHVWTFRDQLCLNLVYNEAFYEKAAMDGFVKCVRDSLLEELVA